MDSKSKSGSSMSGLVMDSEKSPASSSSLSSLTSQQYSGSTLEDDESIFSVRGVRGGVGSTGGGPRKTTRATATLIRRNPASINSSGSGTDKRRYHTEITNGGMYGSNTWSRRGGAGSAGTGLTNVNTMPILLRPSSAPSSPVSATTAAKDISKLRRRNVTSGVGSGNGDSVGIVGGVKNSTTRKPDTIPITADPTPTLPSTTSTHTPSSMHHPEKHNSLIDTDATDSMVRSLIPALVSVLCILAILDSVVVWNLLGILDKVNTVVGKREMLNGGV